MERTLKLIALCTMLVCSLVLVSGCGVGDKFEGKWVGMIKDEIIAHWEIKKNGDGYLITAKRYRLMNVDKTNLKWRIVDDLENDGGTAKDNLLNVPKTGGALTYNESDKTLKTMPYPTVPAAVMHKDDDGKEFERLKAELLAKKKAELEKKYPGIEITVEE